MASECACRRAQLAIQRARQEGSIIKITISTACLCDSPLEIGNVGADPENMLNETDPNRRNRQLTRASLELGSIILLNAVLNPVLRWITPKQHQSGHSRWALKIWPS